MHTGTRLPLPCLPSRAAPTWARPRYQHVISLGYFCSTALELQRYGLRDASYPLDWNITPIRPAIAMVESGFEGFLELDCLRPEASRVLDTRSGIFLYNDFDAARPVAEQYGVVRERYVRRIERFRRAIQQPTLFVRYIDAESHQLGDVDGETAVNLEEFAYLDENMAAVLAVLRRTNPLNELLLIGNEGLPATCGGLPVYTVAPDEGDWVARRFLQNNPQLRQRLLSLHYPIGSRARNLLRYWLRCSWQWLRGRLALRTRLRRLHLCGSERGRRRTSASRPSGGRRGRSRRRKMRP